MKIKIDEKGRIVIPKIVRKFLKIELPDELEITLEDDKIIIWKEKK